LPNLIRGTGFARRVSVVRSFRSILLGFAIVLTAGPALAATGPVISVSARTIDFGNVPQQQLLHQDLFIRNEGDAPLLIYKIDSSCGCTGVIMADSVVAPGEVARVDVSFSTRDYQGPQEKQLQIRSNDPAERIIKIAVKADVTPIIEVSEEHLDFETVKRGETPEQTVLLSAKPGFGLEVKKIEGAEEWFAASAACEKSAGKEVCSVRLKLKPTAPAGPYRQIIRVFTAGAVPRVIDLTVGGQVVSYFRIDGDSRLNFSITEKGVTSTVFLKILCDGAKGYRLDSVESSLAFVTGEIAPDGANAFRVKFTLHGTAPAGPFRGNVKIHTTDPEQPIISVGVQGLVRG
jgi:hypothetical protein